MFPQGGNVTDISNFQFPSSLQNTETRYFFLYIYAVRMQEFRKAATKLCCTKTPELAPVQPLTLQVRTQAIPVEERT